MPLFFTVLRKIESSAPLLSYVREAEVTLLSEHFLHRPYSAFDTLFPSFIIYSCYYKQL